MIYVDGMGWDGNGEGEIYLVQYERGRGQQKRGRKEVVPGFRAEFRVQGTSLISVSLVHDVLGFGNVRNDVV